MTDTSWEHAAEARAALNAIVADPEHGAAALSSPQTMSNLLKDLLPDAPREKSILVAAAEAGLAVKLREHVDEGMDPSTAIRLTASSFSTVTPYPADACEWVTGQIAGALGISPAGGFVSGAKPQGQDLSGAPTQAAPIPGYQPPGQAQGYQPVAGQGFGSAPGQGYSPAGQDYSPPAGQGFGSAPGQGYSPSTDQGFGSAPGQAYSPPGQGFGSAPSQGFGSAPGQGFGSAPGQGFGSAPGQGFGSAPGQGYAPPVDQGRGSTPGRGYLQPDAAGGYSAGQLAYQPPIPGNQSPPKNGMAIAALVLGIVQFPLWIIIVPGLLAALTSIVLGGVSMSQIKRSGAGGKGMAIAGIVLSVIAIVTALAITIAVIATQNKYSN